MPQQPYESPAIVELGSLHERTLNWMVGGDGLGFSGRNSAANSSVSKVGGYIIKYVQVDGSGKSSKSGKSKHSQGDSGDASEKASKHVGFDLNDALRPFGGTD